MGSVMPADARIAAGFLEEALKLDPDYAAAHALLAWCHEIFFARAGLDEADKIAGIQHARAAINGEFAVAAKVNGARVTFLFDTGASVVVLTAADARRAGIDTRGLDFDVPVTTANGAAMAAEVRLDSIEVGPIVMRNVRALVARPGALEESLLGMSFLERLKSYAVERGRLILTAR